MILLPQPVNAPLTRATFFLTVTINPGAGPCARVRSLCGDLASLVRGVGFRAAEPELSCVLGIGSEAWDRLFGQPRPAHLRPFREIRSAGRHAVATPGDLHFHIRAQHFDLCFELGTQITARLSGTITVVDEVHGFRYFDARDLLGFVDGTENPTGQAAIDATLIGEEDAAFAGGSYVIVQKYLHDLAAWNALPVEEQERIIGRAKLSDIETDDAKKAPMRTTSSRRSRKTAKRSKFCETTCHSVGQEASSAPTSSVTAGLRKPLSKCSRTCSLASRPETMTDCWISAEPSLAACSLCLPPSFSTT